MHRIQRIKGSTRRVIADLVIIAGSLAMTAPALANEASTVTTERSRVSLISDRTSVWAGNSLWVGLRFQLAPGWHTYWRNPGDAGNPAKIEWELPDGLVAGVVRWPRPERIGSGPLMSFGYEDEVVLLTRMSVFSLPVNTSEVTVRARADWLVCADICVPEQGRLTLQIPVSKAAERDNADAAAQIERFVKRLPRPAPPGSTFHVSGGTIELSAPHTRASASLIKEAWFFPSEYGFVDHPAQQPWSDSDDLLRIELKPGELALNSREDSLEGVLVVRYEDGSESSWSLQATAFTGE